MGTIYASFEARIRQDLSDSGSPPLLSAADLDRHVDHAVRDLGLVAPLDLLLTATLTPGSRNVDLSATLAAYQLLRLEAVEWPTGQYPQEFVQFTLFGDVDPVLTLLVETVPSSADSINLYAKVAPAVTSSAGTSTLPAKYDDVIAIGAAGYAAQELATRLMNQINIGGPAVWEHYLTLSTQLLSDFGQELDLIANHEQFFVKRLYSPEYPPQGISQTEVYPPETLYP
jgi:hypothetical protein